MVIKTKQVKKLILLDFYVDYLFSFSKIVTLKDAY